MSDDQRTPTETNATTAAGRPIPEQVGREHRTAPDETRPAVPEQALAPAEETLAPAEAASARSEQPVEAAPRRRRIRRRKPRRQSAFRRWRKTRPFWGGLLTMLGGVEIAVINAASYKLLFVSKSVGFAIAVGAAIAVLGLTMWLSPALSKLLGLLTLVAALLSFVTSNLGGFLLGMLLGILGGGLSFAWEPGVAREASAAEPPPDEEASTGSDSVEDFHPLDHLLEE